MIVTLLFFICFSFIYADVSHKIIFYLISAGDARRTLISNAEVNDIGLASPARFIQRIVVKTLIKSLHLFMQPNLVFTVYKTIVF